MSALALTLFALALLALWCGVIVTALAWREDVRLNRLARRCAWHRIGWLTWRDALYGACGARESTTMCPACARDLFGEEA